MVREAAHDEIRISFWAPLRSLRCFGQMLVRPTSFLAAWNEPTLRRRSEALTLLFHVFIWANVFLFQICLVNWSLTPNQTLLDFSHFIAVILANWYKTCVILLLMIVPLLFVVMVSVWRKHTPRPAGTVVFALCTTLFFGAVSTFGYSFSSPRCVAVIVPALLGLSVRAWHPLKRHLPKLAYLSAFWVLFVALIFGVITPVLHFMGLKVPGGICNWYDSGLIIISWLCVRYGVDQQLLHLATLRSEAHPNWYRWHPLYLFDYCPTTFVNLERILVPFAVAYPDEWTREATRLEEANPCLKQILQRVRDLTPNARTKQTNYYEAQPPLRSRPLGIALVLMGAIWGLMVAVPVVLPFLAKQQEPREWLWRHLRDMPIFVVGVVISLFATKWLRLNPATLWRAGLSLLSRDARQLLTITQLPTVLYLRAFIDDVASRSLESSAEEVLSTVFAGSQIGTMVAIGRPGEALQTAGAARLYVGADWQDHVRELMERAKLVVLRVGSSEGVWWEIDEALRKVAPPRLLIWMPSNPVDRARLQARLSDYFDEAIPEHFETADFLWFNPDGRPVMLTHSNEYLSLLDYRIESPLKHINHLVEEQSRLRDLLSIVLRELGGKWRESRDHSARAGLLTGVWMALFIVVFICISPIVVLLRLGDYGHSLIFLIAIYLGSFFVSLVWSAFASNTSFFRLVYVIENCVKFTAILILRLGAFLLRMWGNREPTPVRCLRSGVIVTLVACAGLLIGMYVAMFATTRRQRIEFETCKTLQDENAYETSRQSFQTYVAHWPNDADGWLGLAQANRLTNRGDEADESMKKAYHLLCYRFPFDADRWYQIGRAWEDSSDPARASIAYRNAIEANANELDVFYRLSLILEERNEPVEALTVLERGLKYQDKEKNKFCRGGCLIQRGRLLAKTGRYEEAIMQFRDSALGGTWYASLVNEEINTILKRFENAR